MYGPQVKEILLINNNSQQREVDQVLDFAQQRDSVKLLHYAKPFNYQKLNNWAVKQSTGKFILFLNNDTELVKNSIGLIESMYNKAKDKKIGAVGCLLLYGDNKTIQHGGVYLVTAGLADHIAVGKKYHQNNKDLPAGLDYTKNKELVAVTGAVTVVERKKFDEVKGFDERFIVCGGDVDLCIRLARAGYKAYYIGEGYILHKESQSRKGQIVPYNDFARSYQSYMQAYDKKNGDPYIGKYLKQ